ncbi:MAG: hypothetical protein RQ899_04710 [Pseudomonadales bacterium]|nr:hypothetical protein [Pseudomonadales bacterium]
MSSHKAQRHAFASQPCLHRLTAGMELSATSWTQRHGRHLEGQA